MFDVFDDSIVLGKELAKKQHYTLYTGMQRVVENVSRPVVIKKITRDDKRKIQEEIELLADIGNSPFITGVLASGIDKENTGWIVFDDLGKSLREITDRKPAELNSLALLLSHLLQACIILHERDIPVLYNPLLPDNIACNPAGSWTLCSYLLQAENDEEQILSPEYAKYMAPETFDAENFTPSVQGDLYSLGMIIYEYALGSELFEKQFPAVYNRHTSEYKMSNTVSERWMYWHTSEQIVLPTLQELLPSVPDDLSRIVAQMLNKDVKKRAGSAQALFDQLVRTDVNFDVVFKGKKESEKKPLLTPMVKILLVVLLFALAGGVVSLELLLDRHEKIEIKLDKEKFITRESYIRISGVADYIPPGARIMVELKQGLISVHNRANYENNTGKFVCLLELQTLGNYEGLCAVLSSEGSVLFCSVFSVRREAPDKIQVSFVFKPEAVGAKISIESNIQGDTGEKPTNVMELESDSEGRAVVDLKYGEYIVAVTHPYYHEYRKIFSTGYNQNSMQEIELLPLNKQEIEQRKLQLQREYEELLKNNDPNNPDPEKLKKMTEIQKELSQLIQPDAINPSATKFDRSLNEKRNSLNQKLKSLRELAEKGDPEAIKEYAKTLNELHNVNKDSIEASLRDLQHQRNVLLNRARNGDYSAVEKLKQLDQSLRDEGIDPNNITAGLSENLNEDGSPKEYSKEELLKMMHKRQELLKRAEAGDPQAQKELEAMDADLRAHGVNPNVLTSGIFSDTKDKEKEEEDSVTDKPYSAEELMHLNRQREELLKRAEAGDPEALQELQKLDADLRSRGIDPDALSDVITQKLQEEKATSGKLLKVLSTQDLAVYVRSLMPAKAVTVRADEVLKKLNVHGYVYDSGELEVLLYRLQPLQQYLEVNITVDPNKITENIQEELDSLGVSEARVHPFLIGPQFRMYIGVSPATSADMLNKIKQLALDYVSSLEAVSVQKFPEEMPHEE